MYRGDSHIRRINKNLFNNSINEGKAHLNSFSGATINKLDHFIAPILEKDRLDIVIIRVGSNHITHNTINNIDTKSISKRIIDIGKKCLLYSVREVTVSWIFIKWQFKLTRIIRQVNDHLRDECRSNKFHFISRDNITKECLWKGGLHLNNDGIYMFDSNLVDFLNGFIFNRNIWLNKGDNRNLGKENCKQGFDLPTKTKQSNKIDYSNNVTSNK